MTYHVLGSQIVGEDAKEKGTRIAREKLARLSPVSFRFIFVFALTQFSGPDYLGAWNRLIKTWLRIPTGRRQTSWPYASVTKALNSGLSTTTPESGDDRPLD